ncbi:MAG: hypothetical protein ACLT8K_14995 [Bacteroides stercoris]
MAPPKNGTQRYHAYWEQSAETRDGYPMYLYIHGSGPFERNGKHLNICSVLTAPFRLLICNPNRRLLSLLASQAYAGEISPGTSIRARQSDKLLSRISEVDTAAASCPSADYLAGAGPIAAEPEERPAENSLTSPSPAPVPTTAASTEHLTGMENLNGCKVCIPDYTSIT